MYFSTKYCFDDDQDECDYFDNDDDVWYLICEDMIEKCNRHFMKIVGVDFDFQIFVASFCLICAFILLH